MGTSDGTSETAVLEILLQENELPPEDKFHLTLMSLNDYRKEYRDPPKLLLKNHRLSIVLPLYVGVRVIPIPFIVDTGAPGAFYLGTGARNKLEDLNVIKEYTETVHKSDYWELNGVFRYNQEESGKKESGKTFAINLPKKHEGSLKNDVRANLLGIGGMKILKVDIIWSQLL